MTNRNRKCRRCRTPMELKDTGRPRLYCSDRCRQAGHRRKAKARVKKRKVLSSSKSDNWPLDPDRFAELDREFHFTLDACATPENAKCAVFFTKEQNSLAQPWSGRVYCNPPYGRGIEVWVRKAREAAASREAELVVCLVPARVDTRWWHEHCTQGEVRFFQGRLRFGDMKYGAPFPSALVIFRRHETVTKPRPSACLQVDMGWRLRRSG